MDIHQIKRDLGVDWDNFATFFRQTVQSEVPLINEVNEYILQRRGKQLRPVLTLLVARLLGSVNKSVHIAACSIEMLHTASLLHDDVVDNADHRRGAASVKAAWKSPIAVLTGDYWLSKASQLIVENNEIRLMPLFVNCLLNLSEGELFQLQKTVSLDTTEEDYFKIIEKKTAILFATSMAAGAITTNASEDKIKLMYDIGYNMGIAFQIRDDTFDYELKNKAGKLSGNDIKEQKMTLPLLCALKQVDNDKRQEIKSWIKDADREQKNVSQVIKFVNDHQGVLKASEKMQEYRQKAINLLQQLPDSEERQALIALSEYMASRKK